MINTIKVMKYILNNLNIDISKTKGGCYMENMSIITKDGLKTKEEKEYIENELYKIFSKYI